MLLDRVMRRVWSRGDCWEWRGALFRDTGYGAVNIDGKTRTVHSFVYMMVKGSVPLGMEIDHICGHRWCVRPSHLVAVTHSENMLAAFRRVPYPHRTMCKYGHPLSGENLKLTKQGWRKCRICLRRRDREFYWKSKGAPSR